LTGTVPTGLDLDGELTNIRSGYRSAERSIESIRNLTRPLVDLRALAAEKSPPGAVARMLLAMQDDPEHHPLIKQVRQAADALHRHQHFALIDDLQAIEPASTLEQASWSLLNALLAQKEAVR
jgi:hypothetical protein